MELKKGRQDLQLLSKPVIREKAYKLRPFARVVFEDVPAMIFWENPPPEFHFFLLLSYLLREMHDGQFCVFLGDQPLVIARQKNPTSSLLVEEHLIYDPKLQRVFILEGSIIVTDIGGRSSVYERYDHPTSKTIWVKLEEWKFYARRYQEPLLNHPLILTSN